MLNLVLPSKVIKRSLLSGLLLTTSSFMGSPRDIVLALKARVQVVVPIEILLREIYLSSITDHQNLYLGREVITGGFIGRCDYKEDGSISGEIYPTPRLQGDH